MIDADKPNAESFEAGTEATQSLSPVTQADREEAAEYLRDHGYWYIDPDEFRAGSKDSTPLVQAFARHRISHSLPRDVESVARTLFCYQHQGDIADPGQVWDAPDKSLHPIYWTQKMEHNHPHYRAMARVALAARALLDKIEDTPSLFFGMEDSCRDEFDDLSEALQNLEPVESPT